ncbi:unnamed protein product, partial [Mesorhabditis belari]|uniref:Uncharacterized protein n=1 Tax=Mesorhabditis belari TaxID=2138241 RepID=A0AAF3EJU1_9BILA
MAGLQLPACALGGLPICNQLNGLYSGNCPHTSSYLNDINSLQRYEGQHIYTIYSKMDQVVGFLVCGGITSQIGGQEGERIVDSGWELIVCGGFDGSRTTNKSERFDFRNTRWSDFPSMTLSKSALRITSRIIRLFRCW